MKVVVKRTPKRVVKIKYGNGGLEILANYFVTQKRLKAILDNNIEWIKSQQSKCDKISEQDGKTKNTITVNQTDIVRNRCGSFDGDIVCDIFVGTKTLICGDLMYVKPTQENKTYLEGNVIYVSEKLFDDKQTRLFALRKFIKKLSATCVADEVSQFGCHASLCPTKIEFKDLQREWCNCEAASQRCICLNYKISQLPSHLRRYVIAHAFAHFGNKTHNDNYCNELQKLVSDFAALDAELKEYAFLLDVFC